MVRSGSAWCAPRMRGRAVGTALLGLLLNSVPGFGFELTSPVACDIGRDCFVQSYVAHPFGSKPRDYTCGTRTYGNHNGTDFRLRDLRMMRAGVNVQAAAPGKVLRTRNDVPDGEFLAGSREAVAGRECGNGLIIAHEDGWETQYCHLAQGSVVVEPGQQVKRGDVLGRVGLSGQTEFPHLHITVRRGGTVVDPFAIGARPGTCSTGTSLWDASLQGALAFHQREVINRGEPGRAGRLCACERTAAE